MEWVLTGNLGIFTVDLSGVEHLEIRTLGGADSVFVQDLSVPSTSRTSSSTWPL